jgi:hypothetical protein
LIGNDRFRLARYRVRLSSGRVRWRRESDLGTVRRVRTLLLILFAAACTNTSNGKGAEAGAECPALSVTADGVSLPAMTNGLAFSYRVNGTVTWHVDHRRRRRRWTIAAIS